MNEDEQAKLPTPRLAVALHYDGRGAPRVVAKGRGEVADKIMELARENDIPLHDDPQLCAILAKLELGSEIPESLYRAVAEVLSFALMLSGRQQEVLQRAQGNASSAAPPPRRRVPYADG
ncbi:MAG: EscU/YscU/HrcU family type III secretion system export apparatus switch protein [Halothiobacillaceae bacterium]|jgi:flagellar biosynthesis protein|nr:EscU/YscU/HrcU family type III secretion system export apparatus switch protein [Halothiobacillaceae bacterium]MDY0050680.1 EscU/YscU/HrcU family type III secretion system export apparatus switch protein [Halothiobacillaceae bacterium]